MDIIQGNENNIIILKILLGEDQDTSYQSIILCQNGRDKCMLKNYVRRMFNFLVETLECLLTLKDSFSIFPNYIYTYTPHSHTYTPKIYICPNSREIKTF